MHEEHCLGGLSCTMAITATTADTESTFSGTQLAATETAEFLTLHKSSLMRIFIQVGSPGISELSIYLGLQP